MRPRTAAILLAVAALLTAYAYLFEREPLKTAIGPIFPRLQLVDIAEIEIRPGAPFEASAVRTEPILLKRVKGGEWWIEKPAVPARIPRVESIAWSLVELQRISDVPLSEQKNVFDPRGPEVTVRFKVSSGEEHRVEVGQDYPDVSFDLTYILVDGKGLYLTRKSFKKNVQSRLDDLRSRALFPVPKERAVRIEVAGDERARKVIQREGDTENWRFLVPAPAPAGREEIVRVLDNLNSWQADSFVRDEPGDLAPFGLDAPRLTITVAERDGTRRSLQVGSALPDKGEVYVRWADRPFIMTASAAPAEDLERAAENFYSTSVLQLGAEEIVEVSVGFPGQGPGGDYLIRRTQPAGDAKAAPAPKSGPPQKTAGPPGTGASAYEVEDAAKVRFLGDSERVRILLNGLRFLLVKKYIPKAQETSPEGPSSAGIATSVRIRTDVGAEHSLTFLRVPPEAAEGARNLFDVTADGEPFLFQVFTKIPDDLANGSTWFRNRRISKLLPETLREFEVTVREGGKEMTWTLGRPDEDWKLAEGGDLVLRIEKFDPSLARKVVALFGRADFEVADWAPKESDFDALGIGDVRFRIRISFTRIDGDGQGFRRFYLGQEKTAEGMPSAWWGRIDEPPLDRIPFLLDRLRTRAILDLVDHLKEITAIEGK